MSSMGIASLITAILSIVQLSTVARFLTPEDYGFIVIPCVVVGACMVFLVSMPIALIQREEITDDQIQSMHGYIICIAAGLFSLVVVIALLLWVLQWKAEYAWVLILLSIQLLVVSFGLVARNLFRREMQMGYIAKAQVISAVIGLMVAVALAWLGVGYWALVYAMIAREIALASYARYKSPYEFKINTGFSAAKGMLRFGVFRGVDQILTQFTGKMDQIVIAVIMGQSAVGLYNVSSNIARRPVDLAQPVIGAVMLPLFANIRSKGVLYTQTITKAVVLIGVIAMCISVGVSLFAPEVVRLILGDRWLSAIPILSIIPFYFAFIFISMPCTEVAIANAETKRMLVWSMASTLIFGGALAIAAIVTADLYWVIVSALCLRFILMVITFPYMLSCASVSWIKPLGRLLLSVFLPVIIFYTLIYANSESLVYDMSLASRCLAYSIFCVVLLVINYKFIMEASQTDEV